MIQSDFELLVGFFLARDWFHWHGLFDPIWFFGILNLNLRAGRLLWLKDFSEFCFDKLLNFLWLFCRFFGLLNKSVDLLFEFGLEIFEKWLLFFFKIVLILGNLFIELLDHLIFLLGSDSVFFEVWLDCFFFLLN